MKPFICIAQETPVVTESLQGRDTSQLLPRLGILQGRDFRTTPRLGILLNALFKWICLFIKAAHKSIQMGTSRLLKGRAGEVKGREDNEGPDLGTDRMDLPTGVLSGWI